ncbi:MAG: ComEC/Rec2 family competence protein [Gemmatimonadota bacterium]
MTSRTIFLFLSLLLVAGCGDTPNEPTPDPITISIAGVEDGARYTSAVTIDIATSRGTYSAELDGETFLSGQSVAEVGTHTLVVTARDRGETATASVTFEIAFEGSSTLIVRMLDLGENEAGGGGDAILLTDSAQGVQLHALVDAGPAGVDGSDPGYVADRLQDLGVTRLEALILTHAHSDHFDGIPAVLNAMAVERFVYNGQVRTYSGYTSVVSQARSAADTVIVPTALVPLALSGEGGTVITVIPPITSYLDDPSAESAELNEGSVGAAVTRGAFSMFMTGDGEVEANGRWRRDFGSLSQDVDVLKVGHHGANDAIFDNGYSGSSAWLDHTDPDILLISANGSTHPRHNALTKILGRSNTRAYCTNVHGEIQMRVDPNGEVRVDVQKNAEMDCEAGSQATS